jgi:TonB family protein
MKALLSLSFLLALCWTAPIFGQQAASPSAAPPALTESLDRAFELIGEGKFQMAKAELEKATALAGGPCGECLLGMAHVYAAEGGKWDQVVAAAQQALPLLGTPGFQARAYDQLGVAYVRLNAADGLSKAEEAFRRGAELGGAWGALARYNLAEVELRQQRWADAADAARRYLQEAGAGGTLLKEARVLLCWARAHQPEEAPAPAEEKTAPPSRSKGEESVPPILAAAPMQVEGEVHRPEVIRQVKPEYTEKARRARTHGTVIVEAIIDEEGCVRNIRSLQGLPNGLTEAAMAAVRQWVFYPATLEGKPVKVYYVLTINFQVQVDKPGAGWPPGRP